MAKFLIISILSFSFYSQACMTEKGQLVQIKQINGSNWQGNMYHFKAEDGSNFDLYIDSENSDKNHVLSQELNNGVGKHFQVEYRSIKNDRGCFKNIKAKKDYSFTLLWENVEEVLNARID